MVELAILRLFSKDRSIYIKYKDIYKATTQEQEIKNLYNLISQYYERYEDHTHITKDEFNLLYHAEYPNHKHRPLYEDIINQIFELDISRDAAQDLLNKLVKRDFANRIANSVLPILTGVDSNTDFTNIEDLITEYKNYSPQLEERNPFFEVPIDDILNQTQGDGLRWRLKCLDRALGSPSGGTLGHVFARPEAGKTSFLHSIATYFTPQLSNGDVILWFNNEEAPARILLRSICAMTGMAESEVRANPQHAKELYRQNGGHRIKLVDEAVLSVDFIESLCKEYRPRFVVIDQGDKVAPHGKAEVGNTAERLKLIYDQLREVVKRCNKDWLMDMLTVGQADRDAEGKRVLALSNLDSGKTGKAGAFDYVIGIGYDESQPNTRYISFPKNKLQGDHGTYAVAFDPLRGRYGD
jgi:hypothetical protein